MLAPASIAAIAFFGSALLNAAPENGIASRDATVEGAKLHYLTAGHGPAVILLHGYTQTSRMWRPIIPLLAKKFTVIEGARDYSSHQPVVGWLEVDRDNLKGRVLALPKREDINAPVNEQLIVELYSK